jgi:2-hydroxy-6-oxonona-2,4-dienedioate hydrolase
VTQVTTREYAGMPPGLRIEVSGVDTWYAENGSGPAVIFVYGGNFGTRDSQAGAFAWEHQLASLSDTFRTIAYDKPGQGWTPAPRNDDDYTMDFVVRHLIGFIEALALPHVHLVGHSRGGYIATRATLLRPDLVKTLTIVNSGTLSPGVSMNESVLARNPHPPFTRAAVRWVYEGYCHDPVTVTDAWVERAYNVLTAPAHRATVERIHRRQLLASRFLPCLEDDKRETLGWLREGRLQRPTQIVWGRNDATAVLDRGFELFELLSSHERRTAFTVVDKCGHFPYREHPAWFNETVRWFIAEAGYDHA